MSKRIGELLVEKKLITPLQLDQALKTQLIVGGHLGTCLLELGFIEEEALGRALADLRGLSYASSDRLTDIPPTVLRTLTSEMAEKHQAVPLALEDKTLHVAVIDPKNLGRLSTSTGYKIVPWIAPELRVFEALEVHYKIRRSERLVRAGSMMERRRHEKRYRARNVAIPAGAQGGAAEHLGEAEASAGAGARTELDLGTDYGYGRSWREVADELFHLDDPDDRPTDRPPRPVEAAGPSNDRRPMNLFQRMSRVESKNDLARVVLEHAAQKMTGAILFVVKAEAAMIWDWTGLSIRGENVRSLRFPVTSGAIFTLMLGDGNYRGPVPDGNEFRWFYNALQLDVPEEILLLPVYLDDRLVAIFYGDGGPAGEIRGTTESYERLARKLGLALHMLLLKLKICS